jgi:hypothetical protein
VWGLVESRSELLNKENFAWMIGASVVSITCSSPEYGYWSVRFSNDGSIDAENGTWRLSLPAGIVVSSVDAAPADAIEKAMAALGKARVIDAFVRPGAPDLVVQFENQLVLDVLANFRQYECWKVMDPSGWTFVVFGTGEASGWREFVR